MKNIALLIFGFLISISCFSQKNEIITTETDSTYKVESLGLDINVVKTDSALIKGHEWIISILRERDATAQSVIEEQRKEKTQIGKQIRKHERYIAKINEKGGAKTVTKISDSDGEGGSGGGDQGIADKLKSIYSGPGDLDDNKISQLRKWAREAGISNDDISGKTKAELAAMIWNL